MPVARKINGNYFVMHIVPISMEMYSFTIRLNKIAVRLSKQIL